MDFTVQDSIKDEFITENGIVGRSVLNKLKTDRFFETQENITICFEGVNLSDKIKSSNNFFDEYAKSGISFIKQLKGSYSGFIYDLEQKKVFVFNDHLSTKNIFYYFDEKNGFSFSSELKALVSFLKEHDIAFSLNEDAVYMMSLYGFLLEDHTYIQEIKKLPYSSLIIYDIEKNVFNIEKLFSYSTEKEKINYVDALDRINQLMENSIEKNWSKDISSSTKHLSLLSGGMDARTNIIIAKNLGFKNITTITFGQSDSKDILYAKEIAINEGLNSFQRFLDTPSYLIDNIMENYIIPNDGLMMYQTSAHTSSTVKSFNLSDYQVLHTGQIGDLLFGSFTKENYDFKNNRSSIGYTGFVSNDALLDKIQALPNILPLLIYGMLNSWTLKAGLSDGLRYLFPIIVLFYSYSIKNYFDLLLKFVVFFVVLNFLVQILNYFNWARGIEQWFYYRTDNGYSYYNQTAGIIRATGTVVFFGFLGFLNLVAFFIIKIFYQGKFKKLLLGITLFMLFASVSFKAFGPFLILLLLYYYKRMYKLVVYFLLLLLGVYLTFPTKINEFIESLLLRISLYITEGNSARSESYRVMFNEIGNFNLFGQGVGVFGGPASTAYNSWYYKMVGFNWYDTKWLNLTTTDTFPPHLFVELGIIGGLTYLLVLFTPLFRKKINKRYLVVLAIYFCLFFDMLFSFSLNNLDYLMFSLVFVYPILNYKEKMRLNN